MQVRIRSDSWKYGRVGRQGRKGRRNAEAGVEEGEERIMIFVEEIEGVVMCLPRQNKEVILIS